MDKHIVYVDHAATTYVKPEVFEAMKPYFTEYFGNPSSIYSLGRESKKAIENARGVIAECLVPSLLRFILQVQAPKLITGQLKALHMQTGKRVNI